MMIILYLKCKAANVQALKIVINNLCILKSVNINIKTHNLNRIYIDIKRISLKSLEVFLCKIISIQKELFSNKNFLKLWVN